MNGPGKMPVQVEASRGRSSTNVSITLGDKNFSNLAVASALFLNVLCEKIPANGITSLPDRNNMEKIPYSIGYPTMQVVFDQANLVYAIASALLVKSPNQSTDKKLKQRLALVLARFQSWYRLYFTNIFGEDHKREMDDWTDLNDRLLREVPTLI